MPFFIPVALIDTPLKMGPFERSTGPMHAIRGNWETPRLFTPCVLSREPFEETRRYIDGAFELRLDAPRLIELAGDRIAEALGRNDWAGEWRRLGARVSETRSVFEAAFDESAGPRPIPEVEQARQMGEWSGLPDDYLDHVQALQDLLLLESEILSAVRPGGPARDLFWATHQRGRDALVASFRRADAKIREFRLLPVDPVEAERAARVRASHEHRIFAAARMARLLPPRGDAEAQEGIATAWFMGQPAIARWCVRRHSERDEDVELVARRRLAQRLGIPLLDAESWREVLPDALWSRLSAGEECPHLDYLRALQTDNLRRDWLGDSIHGRAERDNLEGFPPLEAEHISPAELRLSSLPARIVASILLATLDADLAGLVPAPSGTRFVESRSLSPEPPPIPPAGDVPDSRPPERSKGGAPAKFAPKDLVLAYLKHGQNLAQTAKALGVNPKTVRPAKRWIEEGVKATQAFGDVRLGDLFLYQGDWYIRSGSRKDGMNAIPASDPTSEPVLALDKDTPVEVLTYDLPASRRT